MKLDPLIEREIRANSPATKAAVAQVDELIKGLEARKDKLVFEPSNEVDERISALRAKKQKLLAGEIDEDPIPKTASAPSRPKLVDYVSKGLSNPFDSIEHLPFDEAEQKKLMKEAFDFGLDHIAGQLTKFRKATTAKNDAEVPFTQGGHVAMVMTLAWMWVEFRQLFIFARDKRKALEDLAVQNNGWFNSIFARLQAIEKAQTTPFEYLGTFDPEKAYVRGNFVTYQGSMHHAETPSKGVVPGNGSAWKLCVKRGRDK